MATTLRLYEQDAMLRRFRATVLACTPADSGYWVELDRTAFFPEGGGQPCDTGMLGGLAVDAVRLRGGAVQHHTPAPLDPGAEVEGEVDDARRLDAMQQHTGEHILSGVLHRMYGANNVGFHIGQPAVRMDMDLPLTADQLAAAEAAANAAVRANTPVHCYTPDAETLAHTEYRSKKALEGPVRLVEAGGDLCACCGTHLRTTGEVGCIKILSAMKYKGGVRLAVACGARAADAIADVWADAEAAGRTLSSAPGHLAEAAAHACAAQEQDKMRLAALQHTLADTLAATAAPGEPAVWQLPGMDADGLRLACVRTAQATGALCAAFAPGGQGLAYALCLPGGDARPLCRALNAQFAGRGGGKGEFCQGSVPEAPFDALKNFILAWHGPAGAAH